MSLGRSRVALVAASVLAVAFVFGCPRPPPPPPEVKAGPPPIRVPPGCEQNLSGVYAYEGREDWRYDATDDGGTLVLVLARAAPDGGAITAPEPTDAGKSTTKEPGNSPNAANADAAADAGATPPSSVAISLMRTPQGFVGGIEHTAFPAPGAQCTVTFPTEITACDDTGLTLESVETVDVDQACQSPPSDGGAPRKSHRLVRVVSPPTAADSGTP